MTTATLDRCPMCGLLTEFCPCDRRDVFTLPDDDSFTVLTTQGFALNVRFLGIAAERNRAAHLLTASEPKGETRP